MSLICDEAAIRRVEAVFNAVTTDARYLRNIDWGKARSGHPEGTVRAHIVELERNLDELRPRLTALAAWKLRLLIHVHDTFKAEAKPRAAIVDPGSHASLARAFLSEFCDDEDLLVTVQFHDELFSLWRQVRAKGTYNQRRMDALISVVNDWDLFLAFNIVDGCTEGKSRDPLYWLFDELADKVSSNITSTDIIARKSDE
jgi:hypothetical protein